METTLSSPSARLIPSEPHAGQKKMRIAFVYHRSDTMGGAPIHLRDLTRRLNEEGHEARIFIGGDGPFLDNLREHGVPYEPLKYLQRNPHPLRDLPAIFEITSKLRAFRPDLISTHCAKAGFIGRIAGRLLGIPTIYTPHCWPFSAGAPHGRIYRLLEKAVVPFTRHIFLVSENERSEALANRLCRNELMTTIHNGMLDFGERHRANPGLNPPRLMMVARFEEQKDHRTLFHALATLRELDWSLDLVGSGPLEDECQKLATELGLDSRIRFLGQSTKVPELLALAQVFLLITNWEGFPRSTLEAMRAGLPSIITDVGGNREAFAAGGEGITVKHQAVEPLAAALRRLIENPELRVSMGKCARKTFEERFTFETMYQRYLRQYRELVIGAATADERSHASASIHGEARPVARSA